MVKAPLDATWQTEEKRKKEGKKKGTSCHLIESDLLGSFKTKNTIAQQKILSLGSRWTKIQSARRGNLCWKITQLFQQLKILMIWFFLLFCTITFSVFPFPVFITLPMDRCVWIKNSPESNLANYHRSFPPFSTGGFIIILLIIAISRTLHFSS